jgi:hypothetical protein
MKQQSLRCLLSFWSSFIPDPTVWICDDKFLIVPNPTKDFIGWLQVIDSITLLDILIPKSTEANFRVCIVVYPEAVLLSVHILSDIFIPIVPHDAHSSSSKYPLHEMWFANLYPFSMCLLFRVDLAIVHIVRFLNELHGIFPFADA